MADLQPAPAAPQRRWLAPPAPEPEIDDGRGRLRRRVLVVTSLALLLVGVLAGMFAWVSVLPQPLLVPLWVTQYRTGLLTPNLAAQNDRQALLDGPYFTRISLGAARSQDRRTLQMELARLTEFPPGQPLVVYLAAYAGYDPRSGVFVLPSDALPNTPSARLPLADVLHFVSAAPARNKLLVLDIVWHEFSLPMGVLVDEVATRMHEELQHAHDDGLLVLCSCSPAEIAHVSPALGRSVFGFFVEQGLRGYADGCNPERRHDGRISVVELARYVRWHTENFTSTCSCSRQTPVLYGTRDFDLLALAHDHPLPPRTVEAPPIYPAALLTAWQQRDAWLADRAASKTPRLLRQTEEALLVAERRWLYGEDLKTLEAELAAQMQALTAKRAALERETAGPAPRSLARAVASQPITDTTVARALDSLLTSLETQTAGLPEAAAKPIRDKLLATFKTAIKDRPALELAAAVFNRAADDSHPAPDTLTLLDSLLHDEQPQPMYVETLLLRRLAGLSDALPADAWPVASVRAALRATRVGEQATANDLTIPWVRGYLDQAAQLRHDGERILLAVGFAAPATAHPLLDQAAELYEASLAYSDQIQQARQTLDQAWHTLPTLFKLLPWTPEAGDRWEIGVDATTELSRLLAIEPAAIELDEGRLRQVTDELSRKSAAVQLALTDLLRPYSSETVAQLVDQCGWPTAGAARLHAARQVLQSPFLAAADRMQLVSAAGDLEIRLAQQALAATPASTVWSDESLSSVHWHAATGAMCHATPLDQLRWATDLLRLGGLSVDEIQQQLDHLESPAGWSAWHEASSAEQAHAIAQLLDALMHALNVTLPTQLSSLPPLQADQLSRVLPASLDLPLLDDPNSDPTMLAWRRRAVAAWTWLANRYWYASRDLPLGVLSAEAAGEYGDRVPEQRETFARLLGPATFDSINAETGQMTCWLSWQLINAGKTPPALSVETLSTDDNCLTATVTSRHLAPSEPLRFSVVRQPGVAPADGIWPKGFLVRLRVNGRSFHLPVELPAVADSEGLAVLFSVSPQLATPELRQLQLRPSQPARSVFAWVTNSSNVPRKIQAVLHIGSQTLDPIVVDVAPSQSSPLRWTNKNPPAVAAPSPAGSVLPHLDGPVVVELADATAGRRLVRRALPIDVTLPREYVAVDGVTFNPSVAGTNRLSVSLRTTVSALTPPVTARLELLPTEIPNLLKVQGGALQGQLPADGSPLNLFAQGLQLAPTADDNGLIFITIDGVERAFAYHTTFALGGTPTTATELVMPALRVRAAQVAATGAPLAVRIETDAAPPGSRLDVALGQAHGAAFAAEVSQSLPSPRNMAVGFTPYGPQGDWQLNASISDWNVTLATDGLVGQRTLRTRLLSADGRIVRVVEQPVMLDNTPPEEPQFVDPPAEASTAKPLVLSASAVDGGSGIADVQFFLGRPVDNKIPPNTPTTPGQAGNQPFQWTATIPLPRGGVSPVTVSVQFTNGAGLASFATTSIALVEGDVVASGSVHGTVTEGPRPQPNLTVTLTPAAPPAAAGSTAPPAPTDQNNSQSVQTGPDGSFSFTGVKPGKYTVAATKSQSNRQASAEVEVQAGQTVEAPLALELPPPPPPNPAPATAAR